MAGPDDNILGGQDAVIRVGVEADMSEILEQANKFNDLIKDANDSFNVMQTVITSTTTRMASLNSATLRLVSSARQLRSEYQLIAESSQRIGYLGGAGAGEGEGPVGIGGKFLSGLTGGEGRVYETSAGGIAAPVASMAGVSGAPEVPEPVPGLDQAIPGVAKQGSAAMGGYSSRTGALTYGRDHGGDLGTMLKDMVQGGASPSSMMYAAIGKMLPWLGGAMSSAAPVIMPAIGAAVAGYKAIDYAVKGATRYTGMTGGTGVTTSMAEGDLYGFNRGSFIGLQMQKWLPGLANMAVGPQGYGEIQEGLLNAGYKPYGDAQANALGMGGMRWDKTRGTLATLYAKGYQDVGANIALMQTSIESARTSTASFTSSMDALRITAQRTNASMKGLTTAFTTMMKALSSGMGATGNWTNIYAVSAATAYSNARNAALRNGGAVADLSQFGAQVQLVNTPAFAQAGINLENRFMAYSNSPGMAITMAMGTDQAADTLLRYIGIGDVSNMDARELDNLLRNRSNEVEALRNSAMAKSLVGPEVLGDVNAFIEYLVANGTGNPTYKSLMDKIRKAGANPIKFMGTTADYFERTLGDQQSLSRGKVFDFLQEDSAGKSDYSVLSNYYNYVGRTHKAIGWLSSIIRSDEQDDTWVNYRGKRMKLGTFMNQYSNSPEAIKLMESGNLQVATSQDGKRPDIQDFAEAYNIQASEKTITEMTQAELRETVKGGLIDFNSSLQGGKGLKVSANITPWTD